MFRRRNQTGSLYVVVIFILVVMAFLAETLTRIQWSNSNSHMRDVLGSQAWVLARSVNEDTLTQLYPLDVVSSAVEANCKDPMPLPSFVDTDRNFKETTMNCRLDTSYCRQMGELDNTRYYKLFALVRCGSGKSEVERTEEVWVRE